MAEILPVCKTMCATCPFRPGSKHADLCEYLTERYLSESRICHSTGDSVFYGKTGKRPRLCRGSRNVQLQMFHAIGFIEAPTDEAWRAKVKELNL